MKGMRKPARRIGCQWKYLDRHRMEIELKRATPTLDAKPIGRPPTWMIRGIVDADDNILFVCACRLDDSIQDVSSAIGREVNLVSTPGSGRKYKPLCIQWWMLCGPLSMPHTENIVG